MGIRMRLPREDNFLYCDFDNAYWSVEDVTFTNMDGVNHTVFRFNTYPSREAKMMDLHPMQGLATIGFGGSGGGVYSPVLHTWEALARTSDIFPDGIPVEEARQKERLYAWVKEYLALTDYEDVFE